MALEWQEHFSRWPQKNRTVMRGTLPSNYRPVVLNSGDDGGAEQHQCLLLARLLLAPSGLPDQKEKRACTTTASYFKSPIIHSTWLWLSREEASESYECRS